MAGGAAGVPSPEPPRLLLVPVPRADEPVLVPPLVAGAVPPPAVPVDDPVEPEVPFVWVVPEAALPAVLPGAPLGVDVRGLQAARANTVRAIQDAEASGREFIRFPFRGWDRWPARCRFGRAGPLRQVSKGRSPPQGAPALVTRAASA